MQIKVPRKYFQLTVENTEEILRKYIKPNYDINYSIRQSEQSRSIYVTINKYGCDIQKVIRLSDHPGKYLKYHYISKRTRYHKRVGIFINAIHSLDRKNLNKLMEDILQC